MNYIILEHLKNGTMGYIQNDPSKTIEEKCKLPDGTIGYKIVGHAPTAEEAHLKMYSHFKQSDFETLYMNTMRGISKGLSKVLAKEMFLKTKRIKEGKEKL